MLLDIFCICDIFDGFGNGFVFPWEQYVTNFGSNEFVGINGKFFGD